MSQPVCRTNGAVADRASKPLISALVVTCNEEAYLRECLQGLLDQTVADRLEVIVVDQGSQQAEWAVVADLQRQHANIVALRLPAGTAPATALSAGARLASGHYLFALQAPDRLAESALQALAAALDATPDAMAAFGDTSLTAVPHATLDSHTSCGKMLWPEYGTGVAGSFSGVAPHSMWRRDLHDALAPGSEGSYGEIMHDFLARTAQRYRVVHLPEFLALKLVPHEVNRDAQDAPRVAPAAAVAPQASAPGTPKASADDAYGNLLPLLASGNEEAAADALKAHLASYPDHAVAHNDLAALTYRLGDMDASLHHYQEAVRLNPKDSVFRKNLADFYFVEAGRTDEAINIYLALLAESPRDPETLLNLGVICEAVGQPGEAEDFYQRALEIEPWNPTLRERLSALRAATSAVPATVPAAHVTAPVAQGVPAAAATMRQEAVQRKDTAEERYSKVQALLSSGSLEEARTELEGIVASFPNFALAHNDLAVLSYQAGEKTKALQHYEKAARLEPGNSVFQKNLADFYFVDGNNLDSAIAIYLEELRKSPRDVETLLSLGKICNVLHRPEEARTFLTRAVELEPWNPDAREELSLVA